MVKIASGIIVALVCALTFTTCRLQSADARWEAKLAPIEAERDQLRQQVETDAASIEGLNRVNSTQLVTIHDLAGKLDAAITMNERLDELLQDAETSARAAREAFEQQLAAMATQQEGDYANRDCAEWGAAPVCGAVTARVSEQWRAAARRRD